MFKKSIVFLLACISLILSCDETNENANYNKPQQNLEASYTSRPDVLSKLNKIFPVTSQKAVKIAKQSFGKTDEKTSNFIVCDNGLIWAVIDLDEKKEISVSKSSGDTLLEPVNLAKNVFEPQPEKQFRVNQQQAVEIAKNHFIEYAREKLGAGENVLNNYFPSVCDLGDTWKIFFIIKDLENINTIADRARLPNHSPPDYIIDKRTGEIIYFNFNNIR